MMTLILLLLGAVIGALIVHLVRNASNQSRGSWLALAFLGTLLAVAPATVRAAVPIGPDSTAESVLSLDPFMVSVIFGALIPIVGGILLKNSTSGSVKSIVNLALSAIASVINVSTTEGGLVVISEDVVKSTALTFIISVATLYGVWKPAGVDASLKSNVGMTDTTKES